MMLNSKDSGRLSSGVGSILSAVVKDSLLLDSPECSSISLASARCSPPSVLAALIVDPKLSPDEGDPIESWDTR